MADPAEFPQPGDAPVNDNSMTLTYNPPPDTAASIPPSPAYQSQRAGERMPALFPHQVFTADGAEYKVFAPIGVSRSRIMELANDPPPNWPQPELIQEGSGGSDSGSSDFFSPPTNTAQRVVRQAAAPTVGAAVGTGVGAVVGAAATPFTGGIINPWTGAVIGGAIGGAWGEVVNQYGPDAWQRFTGSVKNPVSIATAGLAGAIPSGRLALGGLASTAEKGAQAFGNMSLQKAGIVGEILSYGASLLFGTAHHYVESALGGVGLKYAAPLVSKAITSSAGRAALRAAASQGAGNYVYGPAAQAGRAFTMPSTMNPRYTEQ